MSATSSTILNLPDQRTATLPKLNYINNEDGLLSWLFTGDHKRIAMLYSDLDYVFLLYWRRICGSYPA